MTSEGSSLTRLKRVLRCCRGAESMLITSEKWWPHWRIVRAGDAKRWKEFHRWGVLLFGDPPWKGSQVFSMLAG